MYIRRLSVSNVRCYQRADIEFSPSITLFAGENNSGKSTLIQCLHLLQAGSRLGIESIRFGKPQAEIQIEFGEADPSVFSGAIQPLHVAPDGALIFRAVLDSPNTISMHIGSPSSMRQYQQFSGTQPNNLLVPYLSDRRSAGFTGDVGENFAFSAGGDLQHVSNKIDRCLTSDELGPVFKDTCKQVFGFPLSTQHVRNGKMAGLEVNVRAAQFIPLERLGSGVAQAAGLIAELLLAERKIFLIEELENDIHPAAIRALLDLIERSSSEGNQFIISTHSNVVLRRLGSVANTRIWQTTRIGSSLPPESSVVQVTNEPSARLSLLRTLGYDLSDYELYDSWLVLEESSAERIINEFLIPWFTPRLLGRMRTVAAQGAQDVEPRFRELHRLLVFMHLEPIYAQKSWVIVDGDEAGKEAHSRLRRSFNTWPSERFRCLSKRAFEEYYPAEFSSRVQDALAISDPQRRRSEKESLLKDVVGWLRADQDRGRKALAHRANEVIDIIRNIESQVAPLPPSS